jgi:hypothetical protein
MRIIGSRSGEIWCSTLTLAKIETLSPRFFEALQRRAFTERQVSKIHEFKGFLK